MLDLYLQTNMDLVNLGDTQHCEQPLPDACIVYPRGIPEGYTMHAAVICIYMHTVYGIRRKVLDPILEACLIAGRPAFVQFRSLKLDHMFATTVLLHTSHLTAGRPSAGQFVQLGAG